MKNVIPLEFEGRSVRFSTDGWLHATKLAERFGKRIDHWLDNSDTLEYILALDEHLNGAQSKVLDTRNSGYVKTSRARVDRGGGTWLHPKLAIHFARWLSAKFSVWCDARIEDILHGAPSALDRFNRACKKFDDRKSLASESGRNLNAWRREKPGLICEIERGRELLQMTLGLNHPTQSADQQALP
ncbi:DNA-binding protein [Pseudomonas syringae pv. helianthi]|uniref:DNA-binding protein n=1 Tax=Pseudomonas syringae pv. helianthi TaxID=251654 RepID=A0A0P9RS06_9PSED|nr:KilA-N domain-containing protein [Pseudomonas syringae group genomosp. 7]KPX49009.1 DNA-binding protein [Pseudomonas syringae pv. helianthi]UNB64182.1 KilA-N domain-containing protein [Pseudomonas syringae pv. helianthi]